MTPAEELLTAADRLDMLIAASRCRPLDLDVRAKFWVCPVEDHRRRTGPNGEPVLTVEWDGDLAQCTAPGCGRTNEDERGCNCERYDCAGECCGVGNCTCTPDAADMTERGEESW